MLKISVKLCLQIIKRVHRRYHNLNCLFKSEVPNTAFNFCNLGHVSLDKNFKKRIID
ncbi:hypothetical protein MtrunA17_Chr8g0336981 [Medicago truncatula]|uniref:Uncharacterized protein n=1 Tax=Medicago truncatula TaxID=3880 RepID=A0A396GBS8_MEDTR|nr:hypothetical protein MtrunA17_Chr8g0336981 [Medicago truncatula]